MDQILFHFDGINQDVLHWRSSTLHFIIMLMWPDIDKLTFVIKPLGNSISFDPLMWEMVEPSASFQVNTQPWEEPGLVFVVQLLAVFAQLLPILTGEKTTRCGLQRATRTSILLLPGLWVELLVHGHASCLFVNGFVLRCNLGFLKCILYAGWSCRGKSGRMQVSEIKVLSSSTADKWAVGKGWSEFQQR